MGRSATEKKKLVLMCVDNLSPQPIYRRERTPVSIDYEVSWASEPVCVVLEKR